MHALVTGASGFLGGRLVEMLLERGVRTTVLARAGSVLPPWDRVRVLRAGLDAPLAEGAALSGVTHVFHCAGCSTDWAPRREYWSSNVDGVSSMLADARNHMPRLERFVHVSTTDVYGYPERAGDEQAPRRDVGLPYNQSKLSGEALVWTAGASGMPVTVLRPASIYGPRGKAFVTDVAAMLRQRLMLLVDGGHAPGGFVYVDDVCRAMLLAAESPVAIGEAYNIGSADGTTWLAYTEAMARALGVPPPWLRLPFAAAMALARASELPHRAGVPGHPLLTRHAVYLLGRDQGYSIEKARQQLGWEPRVTLHEGMSRSVRLPSAARD